MEPFNFLRADLNTPSSLKILTVFSIQNFLVPWQHFFLEKLAPPMFPFA
jgi:hypothetical protein